MIKVKLELEVENCAEILKKSLNPENEGYVKCYVENNKLVCVVEGKNVLSALRTIDDLLMCVSLAYALCQE